MGRLSPFQNSLSLGLAIFFIYCLTPNRAAPVQETAASRYANEKGCFFKSKHYPSGHEIETNEPCLNCTCVGSSLMCYLRVCPFIKPLGENCRSELHVGDCCPKYWCKEAYPQITTEKPEAEPTRGCYLDSRYYDEGARIPMDPMKPCEVCYCIRNTSVCTLQKCELEISGCYPQFKVGSCCPSRYNCTDEAATTIPPGIMEPEDYEGCKIDGAFYKDGEQIPSSNQCQNCYCMKHEKVCAVEKCTAPAPNCVPLETPEGQCCPEKYDCPAGTEIPDSATVHMVTTEAELLEFTTTTEAITAISISSTDEDRESSAETLSTFESETMFPTTKGVRRIDDVELIPTVATFETEQLTIESDASITTDIVPRSKLSTITEVPDETVTTVIAPNATTGRPVFYPSRPIPGEGICRHENRTYQNKENVESLDPCRVNCTCLNSVVHCDIVECDLVPPQSGINCKVKKFASECCPKYICDVPEIVQLNDTETPVQQTVMEAFVTMQTTKLEQQEITDSFETSTEHEPTEVTVTAELKQQTILEEFSTTPETEKLSSEKTDISSSTLDTKSVELMATDETSTTFKTKAPLERTTAADILVTTETVPHQDTVTETFVTTTTSEKSPEDSETVSSISVIKTTLTTEAESQESTTVEKTTVETVKTNVTTVKDAEISSEHPLSGSTNDSSAQESSTHSMETEKSTTEISTVDSQTEKEKFGTEIFEAPTSSLSEAADKEFSSSDSTKTDSTITFEISTSKSVSTIPTTSATTEKGPSDIEETSSPMPTTTEDKETVIKDEKSVTSTEITPSGDFVSQTSETLDQRMSSTAESDTEGAKTEKGVTTSAIFETENITTSKTEQFTPTDLTTTSKTTESLITSVKEDSLDIKTTLSEIATMGDSESTESSVETMTIGTAMPEHLTITPKEKDTVTTLETDIEKIETSTSETDLPTFLEHTITTIDVSKISTILETTFAPITSDETTEEQKNMSTPISDITDTASTELTWSTPELSTTSASLPEVSKDKEIFKISDEENTTAISFESTETGASKDLDTTLDLQTTTAADDQITTHTEMTVNETTISTDLESETAFSEITKVEEISETTQDKVTTGKSTVEFSTVTIASIKDTEDDLALKQTTDYQNETTDGTLTDTMVTPKVETLTPTGDSTKITESHEPLNTTTPKIDMEKKEFTKATGEEFVHTGTSSESTVSVTTTEMSIEGETELMTSTVAFDSSENLTDSSTAVQEAEVEMHTTKEISLIASDITTEVPETEEQTPKTTTYTSTTAETDTKFVTSSEAETKVTTTQFASDITPTVTKDISLQTVEDEIKKVTESTLETEEKKLTESTTDVSKASEASVTVDTSTTSEKDSQTTEIDISFSSILSEISTKTPEIDLTPEIYTPSSTLATESTIFEHLPVDISTQSEIEAMTSITTHKDEKVTVSPKVSVAITETTLTESTTKFEAETTTPSITKDSIDEQITSTPITSSAEIETFKSSTATPIEDITSHVSILTKETDTISKETPESMTASTPHVTAVDFDKTSSVTKKVTLFDSSDTFETKDESEPTQEAEIATDNVFTKLIHTPESLIRDKTTFTPTETTTYSPHSKETDVETISKTTTAKEFGTQETEASTHTASTHTPVTSGIDDETIIQVTGDEKTIIKTSTEIPTEASMGLVPDVTTSFDAIDHMTTQKSFMEVSTEFEETDPDKKQETDTTEEKKGLSTITKELTSKEITEATAKVTYTTKITDIVATDSLETSTSSAKTETDHEKTVQTSDNIARDQETTPETPASEFATDKTSAAKSTTLETELFSTKEAQTTISGVDHIKKDTTPVTYEIETADKQDIMTTKLSFTTESILSTADIDIEEETLRPKINATDLPRIETSTFLDEEKLSTISSDVQDSEVTKELTTKETISSTPKSSTSTDTDGIIDITASSTIIEESSAASEAGSTSSEVEKTTLSVELDKSTEGKLTTSFLSDLTSSAILTTDDTSTAVSKLTEDEIETSQPTDVIPEIISEIPKDGKIPEQTPEAETSTVAKEIFSTDFETSTSTLTTKSSEETEKAFASSKDDASVTTITKPTEHATSSEISDTLFTTEANLTVSTTVIGDKTPITPVKLTTEMPKEDDKIKTTLTTQRIDAEATKSTESFEIESVSADKFSTSEQETDKPHTEKTDILTKTITSTTEVQINETTKIPSMEEISLDSKTEITDKLATSEISIETLTTKSAFEKDLKSTELSPSSIIKSESTILDSEITTIQSNITDAESTTTAAFEVDSKSTKLEEESTGLSEIFTKRYETTSTDADAKTVTALPTDQISNETEETYSVGIELSPKGFAETKPTTSIFTTEQETSTVIDKSLVPEFLTTLKSETTTLPTLSIVTEETGLFSTSPKMEIETEKLPTDVTKSTQIELIEKTTLVTDGDEAKYIHTSDQTSQSSVTTSSSTLEGKLQTDATTIEQEISEAIETDHTLSTISKTDSLLFTSKSETTTTTPIGITTEIISDTETQTEPEIDEHIQKKVATVTDSSVFTSTTDSEEYIKSTTMLTEHVSTKIPASLVSTTEDEEPIVTKFETTLSSTESPIVKSTISDSTHFEITDKLTTDFTLKETSDQMELTEKISGTSSESTEIPFEISTLIEKISTQKDEQISPNATTVDSLLFEGTQSSTISSTESEKKDIVSSTMFSATEKGEGEITSTPSELDAEVTVTQKIPSFEITKVAHTDVSDISEVSTEEIKTSDVTISSKETTFAPQTEKSTDTIASKPSLETISTPGTVIETELTTGELDQITEKATVQTKEPELTSSTIVLKTLAISTEAETNVPTEDVKTTTVLTKETASDLTTYQDSSVTPFEKETKLETSTSSGLEKVTAVTDHLLPTSVPPSSTSEDEELTKLTTIVTSTAEFQTTELETLSDVEKTSTEVPKVTTSDITEKSESADVGKAITHALDSEISTTSTPLEMHTASDLIHKPITGSTAFINEITTVDTKTTPHATPDITVKDKTITEDSTDADITMSTFETMSTSEKESTDEVTKETQKSSQPISTVIDFSETDVKYNITELPDFEKTSELMSTDKTLTTELGSTPSTLSEETHAFDTTTSGFTLEAETELISAISEIGGSQDEKKSTSQIITEATEHPSTEKPVDFVSVTSSDISKETTTVRDITPDFVSERISDSPVITSKVSEIESTEITTESLENVTSSKPITDDKFTSEIVTITKLQTTGQYTEEKSSDVTEKTQFSTPTVTSETEETELTSLSTKDIPEMLLITQQKDETTETPTILTKSTTQVEITTPRLETSSDIQKAGDETSDIFTEVLTTKDTVTSEKDITPSTSMSSLDVTITDKSGISTGVSADLKTTESVTGIPSIKYSTKFEDESTKVIEEFSEIDSVVDKSTPGADELVTEVSTIKSDISTDKSISNTSTITELTEKETELEAETSKTTSDLVSTKPTAEISDITQEVKTDIYTETVTFSDETSSFKVSEIDKTGSTEGTLIKTTEPTVMESDTHSTTLKLSDISELDDKGKSPITPTESQISTEVTTQKIVDSPITQVPSKEKITTERFTEGTILSTRKPDTTPAIFSETEIDISTVEAETTSFKAVTEHTVVTEETVSSNITFAVDSRVVEETTPMPPTILSIDSDSRSTVSEEPISETVSTLIPPSTVLFKTSINETESPQNVSSKDVIDVTFKLEVVPELTSTLSSQEEFPHTSQVITLSTEIKPLTGSEITEMEQETSTGMPFKDTTPFLHTDTILKATEKVVFSTVEPVETVTQIDVSQTESKEFTPSEKGQFPTTEASLRDVTETEKAFTVQDKVSATEEQTTLGISEKISTSPASTDELASVTTTYSTLKSLEIETSSITPILSTKESEISTLQAEDTFAPISEKEKKTTVTVGDTTEQGIYTETETKLFGNETDSTFSSFTTQSSVSAIVKSEKTTSGDFETSQTVQIDKDSTLHTEAIFTTFQPPRISTSTVTDEIKSTLTSDQETELFDGASTMIQPTTKITTIEMQSEEDTTATEYHASSTETPLKMTAFTFDKTTETPTISGGTIKPIVSESPETELLTTEQDEATTETPLFTKKVEITELTSETFKEETKTDVTEDNLLTTHKLADKLTIKHIFEDTTTGTSEILSTQFPIVEKGETKAVKETKVPFDLSTTPEEDVEKFKSESTTESIPGPKFTELAASESSDILPESDGVTQETKLERTPTTEHLEQDASTAMTVDKSASEMTSTAATDTSDIVTKAAATSLATGMRTTDEFVTESTSTTAKNTSDIVTEAAATSLPTDMRAADESVTESTSTAAKETSDIITEATATPLPTDMRTTDESVTELTPTVATHTYDTVTEAAVSSIPTDMRTTDESVTESTSAIVNITSDIVTEAAATSLPTDAKTSDESVTESTSSTATTSKAIVTTDSIQKVDAISTIPSDELSTEAPDETDDCLINGTSHKDGQAIVTQDPCEKCHCSSGEISCFRILCKLPKDGCVQNINSSTECCSYDCPEDEDIKISVTTATGHEITEKDYTTPIPISFMFSTKPTSIASTVLVTKTEKPEESTKGIIEPITDDEIKTTSLKDQVSIVTTSTDTSIETEKTRSDESSTQFITTQPAVETTHLMSETTTSSIETDKDSTPISISSTDGETTDTKHTAKDIISTTESVMSTSEQQSHAPTFEVTSNVTLEEMTTVTFDVYTVDETGVESTSKDKISTTEKEIERFDVTKQTTETPTTFDTIKTTFDVTHEDKGEATVTPGSTTSVRTDTKDVTEAQFITTSLKASDTTFTIEVDTSMTPKDISFTTASANDTTGGKASEVTVSEEITVGSEFTTVIKETTAQITTSMDSNLTKLDDIITSTLGTSSKTTMTTIMPEDKTKDAETKQYETSTVTLSSTESTTVDFESSDTAETHDASKITLSPEDLLSSSLGVMESIVTTISPSDDERLSASKGKDVTLDDIQTLSTVSSEPSSTDMLIVTDVKLSTEPPDSLLTTSIFEAKDETTFVTEKSVKESALSANVSTSNYTFLTEETSESSSTQTSTFLPKDTNMTEDFTVVTELPETKKSIPSLDREGTLPTSQTEITSTSSKDMLQDASTPMTTEFEHEKSEATEKSTFSEVTDKIFDFVSTRFTDMMKEITEFTTMKTDTESVKTTEESTTVSSLISSTDKGDEKVTPLIPLTRKIDMEFESTTERQTTVDAETTSSYISDSPTTKIPMPKFMDETTPKEQFDTDRTVESDTTSKTDLTSKQVFTTIESILTSRKPEIASLTTDVETSVPHTESRETTIDDVQTNATEEIFSKSIQETSDGTSTDKFTTLTPVSILSTSIKDKLTTKSLEIDTFDERTVTEMSTEKLPKIATGASTLLSETIPVETISTEETFRTTQGSSSITAIRDTMVTSIEGKSTSDTPFDITSISSMEESLKTTESKNVTDLDAETQFTVSTAETQKEIFISDADKASRATRKETELETTPISLLETKMISTVEDDKVSEEILKTTSSLEDFTKETTPDTIISFETKFSASETSSVSKETAPVPESTTEIGIPTSISDSGKTEELGTTLLTEKDTSTPSDRVQTDITQTHLTEDFSEKEGEKISTVASTAETSMGKTLKDSEVSFSTQELVTPFTIVSNESTATSLLTEKDTVTTSKKVLTDVIKTTLTAISTDEDEEKLSSTISTIDEGRTLEELGVPLSTHQEVLSTNASSESTFSSEDESEVKKTTDSITTVSQDKVTTSSPKTEISFAETSELMEKSSVTSSESATESNVTVAEKETTVDSKKTEPTIATIVQESESITPTLHTEKPTVARAESKEVTEPSVSVSETEATADLETKKTEPAVTSIVQESEKMSPTSHTEKSTFSESVTLPSSEASTHSTREEPRENATEILTKGFKAIETTPTPYVTTHPSVSDSETTTAKDDDYLLDENTCIFEGRIYQSAEQIPRADACEFCFCFRGDIICLQQSCPPPAENCDETILPGFCCPRYECPVYMTSKNLTQFSRRKGVQPIIIQKRIDKREIRQTVEVKGCQFNENFYEFGKTVTSASGPCLHCVCQEDGLMHCDPQRCKPPPPLMLKMNNNFFQSRR